jgi:SAM-dependent methyltransferase
MPVHRRRVLEGAVQAGAELDYQERVAKEHRVFAGQEHLHEDLPPSAHYWAKRYVVPKLAALGVPGIEPLITGEIASRAQRHDDREVVVLSFGSGNGDQELGWLRTLADAGVHNVRMRLLEFNPAMQARAAAAARELGFADRVEFVEADFNTWKADREHDVFVGFHALHHVLDLEHLFGQIRDGLAPDGALVVHDMIGRNGHRRWPEALEVIERIWATMPPEFRHNAVTGEIDEHYDDLDCAVDGFEGIRAEEVLPVLLDYLHPGLFFGYGNVIDPFVERIYGGNLDMDTERDRAFIDHVGVLDDSLIDLGVVTPTRLTAVFHPAPQPLRVHGNRTPERSIRDIKRVDPAGRISFHPDACDPRQLVRGGGLAIGRMNGLSPDGWAARVVEFPFRTTADVSSLRFSGYLPDWMPDTGTVTVTVDGTPAGVVDAGRGLFEGTIPWTGKAGSTVTLRLEADWSINQVEAGLGEDRRPLSYVLVGLVLEAR